MGAVDPNGGGALLVPASGGAPTGAAGGALGGTYPNPTIPLLPWTASAAPVTVQTTDATVTTLATFATTTSKHHALLLIVSAGQSDRSASVMWTRMVSITNAAGTVTIRDTKELGPTDPATAWVISTDVSGTDVRVRVTGVAATTIDWSCTVTSLVGGS